MKPTTPSSPLHPFPPIQAATNAGIDLQTAYQTLISAYMRIHLGSHQPASPALSIDKSHEEKI
jgi:hypothetical protein